MGLAMNEKKTQERARSAFAREFISQYKKEACLPKRDCVRICIAARLAVLELLSTDAKRAELNFFNLREIYIYWRETLGFKTESEVLQFCVDAWRNGGEGRL